MFVHGFLGAIDKSSKQRLEYYQFLYHPSDMARVTAVKMKLKSIKDIEADIRSLVTQFIYRALFEGEDLKFVNATAFNTPKLQSIISKKSYTKEDINEVVEEVLTNLKEFAASDIKEVGK